MTLVKDIDALSLEELIDALVLTNSPVDEYRPMVDDMRNYYSLLSLEQLREKARERPLYRADDPVQVHYEPWKKYDTTPAVVFRKPKLSGYKRTPTEELVSDLYIRKWTADVREINANNILVYLKDDFRAEDKIRRVAEMYNWKGTVVYGFEGEDMKVFEIE